MKSELGPAVIAGLLLFAIYLFTQCPTVHWLDTGELIAGAVNLSVPHPPGEPVWVLLAKGIGLLPLGDLALRTGLLSALTAALVPAAAYSTAKTWQFLPSNRALGWIAAFAPCLTYPLWVQSVRAEVYSTNLLLVLMTLAALGRASKSAPRFWMLAALFGGLSACVHPLLAALAIGPAIIIAAISRGLPRGGAFGATAAMAVVGLAPNLLLPIRTAAGAADPWGLPSSFEPFLNTVLARTFQQNFAKPTWELLSNNIAIQWQAITQGTGSVIPLLALVGVVAVMTSPGRRRAGIFVATIIGATLGAKLTQSMVFSTNVDLHGYLAIIHVLLWGLAALGIEAITDRLPLSRPLNNVLPSALMLLLALGAAFVQASDASRRGNTLARLHIQTAFDAVPVGGTLITSGNNTMFTGLYLQSVEGYRPDVRAVHRSLVGHPWFRKRWSTAPRTATTQWLDQARGRPSSLSRLGGPVVLEARPHDLVDADFLCPTGPDPGWGYYRLVPQGGCDLEHLSTAPQGLARYWSLHPGDVDARLVHGLAIEVLGLYLEAMGRPPLTPPQAPAPLH